MPTLDYIAQQITDGFPADRDRLHDAKVNLDFYRGDFLNHRQRILRENQDVPVQWRECLLMQEAVNKLTSLLYRNDPIRSIPDNTTATDWLQKVYQHNRMHGKWLMADRLSHVSQAGAFQVAGTADPENPIKVILWDAGTFVVFASDDDPTEVETVVTRDTIDGDRTRFRVWTADKYRVFILGKGDQYKQLTQIEDADNPYGTLPFAFAHYGHPTLSFWTGGPGNTLREANAYVNYRMTDLALDIGQLKPMGVASNVSGEWSPRGKYRVGQWLLLPGENDTAGNRLADPKLGYVEPSLAYVKGTWDDIENYISHTLHLCGLPDASVRVDPSPSARSGVSIIAEQAPLVQMAEGRKALFQCFESDLARKVVEVAVAHLGNNGVTDPALDAALSDWQFHARWQKLWAQVPGPETDQMDQWLLDNGLKSRIMVVMERFGFSREEAVDYLEQVREDDAETAEDDREVADEERRETPQDETKEDTEDADDEEQDQ